MKTYIQPGETLTLTAPAALSSGDGVLVGTIFGVAQADAASGAEVEVARRGVFTLPKVGATAFTAGAKIYWDNTNKYVTTTATSNTLIGAVALAAASGDTTAAILLDGSIR